MQLNRRTFTAVFAAVSIAATMTACAEDTPDSKEVNVESEYAAGDLVLEAKPEAIVSLSATATEMLFAIEAGDQVAAVDKQSNYPEDAPITDLDAFSPNIDAIVDYEPDLVVLGHDQDGIADKLEEVSIPVYYAPAASSLEDTYRQISELGALTGHAKEADVLNESISNDLDTLASEVTEITLGKTAYYELDSQLFSLTADTFAGHVLSYLGLENIADEADTAADSGGYPQLSAEYILDANPDYIFIASGDTAADISSRDGWDTTTAVKEGNIIELDPDLASRWGPRVVDLMRSITETINA